MVCIRLPHEKAPGRRLTKVWQLATTTTNAIMTLADNAQSVKQVPGRPRTDKLDAVWLARLNERGMVHPLFHPARRDPPAP